MKNTGGKDGIRFAGRQRLIEVFQTTRAALAVGLHSHTLEPLKFALVASDLRQAGYIAELDLNGQVKSGLEWVLNVQEGPFFAMENKGKGSKFEAGTIKAILKFLGEKGADKGSPA